MSVFLAPPCRCNPCTPPPPDNKCDYLAFLYGNGRVPINTSSYFPTAEHVPISYTVARLPYLNGFDRRAGLGPPPTPPDEGTEEGTYYYDQTGAGSFYQLVDGDWVASSGPPEYGHGAINATWAVALQECGCPHMIPADAGALQWGDGDTADKTFSITPGCPGPPTFWGCNGALGGGERARVQLAIQGSDRCATVDTASKAPFGANLTAICVHHWPNGGTDTRWAPQYTSEVGACRVPSVDLSLTAANALFGVPAPTFAHSFQRRVTTLKNLAGREVGRIEEDFDETGQWLVQSRARGVTGLLTTWGANGRIVTNTPELFEEVNTQVGSNQYGWRRKVTASMPAVTPYDKAGQLMADPPLTWDFYPTLTGYATTSGGGWDTIRTIDYGAFPPPIANFPAGPPGGGAANSVSVRLPGYLHAFQSRITVNCGGSYAGNPHPSRWEAFAQQVAIDPATGAQTVMGEVSLGDITDSSATVGPADVDTDPGFVALSIRGIGAPPGCPMPSFVCFPGLPPCA